MFLRDFLQIFSNQPGNLWVDVQSVERLGNTVYIQTAKKQEEIDAKITDLEEDLKIEKGENERLEKELFDEKQKAQKLEEENDEIFQQLAEIKEGEVSFKDLLERLKKAEEEEKELVKTISDWRVANETLSSEIKKLRSRKNKVLISRSFYTGKLVTEFEGKKYYLTEIPSEIPAEKA